MKGLLVTMEGTDGSGKSDVTVRLTDALHGLGHRVTATWEPSTGPVGLLIRSALKTPGTVDKAALGPLFAADRADHVARVIAPSVAAGEVVLCDRYDLSNVVYRAAEVPGPLFQCDGCNHTTDDLDDLGDPAQLQADELGVWAPCSRCTLSNIVLRKAVMARALWSTTLIDPPVPVPDLTVILDVPPETSAQRRRARGGAEELYDAGPVQRRVRSLYRIMPSLFPLRRFACIDATGPIEAVVDACLAAIRPILPPI